MEDSQGVEGNDEESGHSGDSMEMLDVMEEEDDDTASAPSSFLPYHPLSIAQRIGISLPTFFFMFIFFLRKRLSKTSRLTARKNTSVGKMFIRPRSCTKIKRKMARILACRLPPW